MTANCYGLVNLGEVLRSSWGYRAASLEARWQRSRSGPLPKTFPMVMGHAVLQRHGRAALRKRHWVCAPSCWAGCFGAGVNALWVGRCEVWSRSGPLLHKQESWGPGGYGVILAMS